GTSIGAVNGAFLAFHGVSLESIQALVKTWRQARQVDLMPSNYLWLAVRALFNRPESHSAHIRTEFLITHGLDPHLRFGDLSGVRLITVAADLKAGRPVLFGLDPEQTVLEGVLASMALPPWETPLQRDNQLLIDGGVVSNLPLEPALTLGATEIIALDLADSRDVPSDGQGFQPFMSQLVNTVQQRQVEMELAMAYACRVPVRRISLVGRYPVPLWDFEHTDELIANGYTLTCQEIERWQAGRRPSWWPFKANR
ncbi:MAG TPA: patatin-like phospholipase family protein, partial [Anaerolineales bacterium]